MYNEYGTITYKVSFKQLSELSIKLAVIILTTENEQIDKIENI